MTDTVDLENSLRAFIAEGSGLAFKRVVHANQNTSRWKLPYATLLLAADPERLGYPNTSDVPLSDDDTAVGVLTETGWQSEYQVQFYRDGAIDLARTFMGWAESTPALDYVLTLDPRFEVVWPLTMQRLDVPEIGDDWERRAVVTMRVEWSNLRVDRAASISGWSGSVVSDPDSRDEHRMVRTVGHGS